MSLDLAHLEDFQALVESGNFSRAALQRNLTQPAFSRRIRALEDWAGATLFEREAQPIILTRAGQALQPRIGEVLRCLSQGRDEARAVAERAHKILRFAATHVLSFTFFPVWLRGQESGQPLDAVQLVSDSLSVCEHLMLQGQAQFLLCHHHVSAPVRLDRERFTSVRVSADVLLPVVAPGSDGSPRYGLPPRGPAPVPILAYSDASGLGRIVAAARPDTAADMRLDPVFTSHLAAALRTMALTGRGIAWLPRSLIADDLEQGRLVRAGPPGLDIEVDIHLFRPVAELDAPAEQFWAQIAAERTPPLVQAARD